MASLPTSEHFGASAAAGSLLITYILNSIFFGVLSFQVYLYSLAFNDRLYIKAVVYVIYALECVQLVLFTCTALEKVVQFGSPLAVFDEIDTIWLSVPIISGLIGCIGQSLYAYRLYKLTTRKYITSLMLAFSLFQLGLTFGLAFEARKQRRFTRLFGTPALAVTGIWGIGSAICDSFIAGSMIYCLTRWDTIKESRTHDIVWKIVRLTIETGLLTVIISVLAVILVLLPGRPPYYQIFIGIIGKAYSNSVMVILNSRITISAPSCSLACQSEASAPARELEDGLVFAPAVKDTDSSGTFLATDVLICPAS